MTFASLKNAACIIILILPPSPISWAILTAFILLFIFRKENQPLTLTNKAEVNDLVPSFLMGGVIVLLIIASFLPEPTNANLVTLYNLRI